jgi:hypothetical protein
VYAAFFVNIMGLFFLEKEQLGCGEGGVGFVKRFV